MKIEKLTKEQEAKFPFYVKKWTDIGLCTKRADRKKAEDACRDAYKVAGLKPPNLIVWAESPVGLFLTAKVLKEFLKKENFDSVRDSVWASVRASVRDSVRGSVSGSVWASVIDSVWASVRDSVRGSVWASVSGSVSDNLKSEWEERGSYGQHDADWLSFYDFFKNECALKVCKKLEPLMSLAEETQWNLFYKNVAILSEKSTTLHRDANGRLNNFDEPAMQWSDGCAIYYINGMMVPEYIVKTNRDDFTKEIILKEDNADYRGAIISKIGIEKTIEILGAKVVDIYESKVGGQYELLMVNYDGRGDRPYLKMRSQSIDAYHIEGLHPKVKTVKEAIAYRNGLKIFVEPETLS